MEIKKEPRGIHTIRCNNQIWKAAIDSKINISETCEQHLQAVINVRTEILNAISTCFLCKEKKDYQGMFKLAPSILGFEYTKQQDNEGHEISRDWFVCRECLNNVKNGKTQGYDKEGLAVAQECLREEEINISKGEKPFTDTSLSFYDSEEYSIKEFIQKIKDNPLADWTFELGKISVPLRDIDSEYKREEDLSPEEIEKETKEFQLRLKNKEFS